MEDLEHRNCKRIECTNTWSITPSHPQEYCSEGCSWSSSQLYDNDKPFYSLIRAEEKEESESLIDNDGTVQVHE